MTTLKRFFFGILFFLPIVALGQANGPTLKEKLDLQWQLYKQAQALLLQQVQRVDLPVDQRLIPRAQWEGLLSLSGPNAFTQADIQELRKDQNHRISVAKWKAKRNSTIDLDRVRSLNRTKDFCESVPKGAMLHIHPFGTLDRQTADFLLRASNPALQMTDIFHDIDSSGGNVCLYSQERSWLEQIPLNTSFLSLSSPDQKYFESFLFLPPEKQPFSRFNGVFEFLGFAISDWDQYYKVLLNFAKKAVREGVIYAEFTTGTGLNLYSHLATLEKDTGLEIRANNSFNRTMDVSDLDKTLQQLLAAPASKYLVGIDFLDNEETNPAFEKGQLLYGAVLQANLSGTSTLHRTMHAGEIGDIRNPRDAMILGAERLGHGVNLAADPVALEYAAKIHEPVEINLSSNLRLTSVTAISQHPFLNYLRLGIPVSLSTDDEGIFDTDINQECELAVGETDMSYSEFKQMAFNGVETSFATDQEKQSLLSKLTQMFSEFEKNFHF